MTLNGFAYDLALARYAQIGERWVEARVAGRNTPDEDMDRIRRAFRREEKRERKRRKRAG